MLNLRDWRALVLWPGVSMVMGFAALLSFGLDRPIANALFLRRRPWLDRRGRRRLVGA